jgi:hypothetical protein
MSWIKCLRRLFFKPYNMINKERLMGIRRRVIGLG